MDTLEIDNLPKSGYVEILYDHIASTKLSLNRDTHPKELQAKYYALFALKEISENIGVDFSHQKELDKSRDLYEEARTKYDITKIGFSMTGKCMSYQAPCLHECWVKDFPHKVWLSGEFIADEYFKKGVCVPSHFIKYLSHLDESDSGSECDCNED